MLGISTSWNFSWEKDIARIIEEILALGFRDLELNFKLTAQAVAEIAQMVKKGSLRVVSCHNFCPLPPMPDLRLASPDYFSLAALDETERKKAVFYTQQSIETASALGARVLVLHLGRVEIKDQTRFLGQLYTQGLSKTPEYAQIKSQMFTERAAGVPPHLEQVFQSLEDLLPVAKKNNLVLGVENRYYFREIPSLEEIHQIFKRFSSSSLFYWHDVGHAQVSENLGFSLHADFLQSFSPRMAGIHLHDVKGIKDHLAPGDGDFNFAQLTPYLKNNPLMVLEAHSPATAQQITLAKLYLEKLFAQQLKNKD